MVTNNIVGKSLLLAPVWTALVLTMTAEANTVLPQVDRYVTDNGALGQVTSVSQLRDVQPTDWAFQALQSLVERYGCIAGYPDGTYRGNRAMTRYEFAAGLNACLDRVNELIASATADLVSQDDLALLQRLQEDFQAELATLRGRVDGLEARTAKLEASQFSTTTKLRGEAIFDLGGILDGSANRTTITPNAIQGDSDDEVTLGYRLRLRLDTSFTGKDQLRTRLQSGNIQSYASRNTFEGADATYDTTTNNQLELNELYYRFPVGSARVFVGARGLNFDTITPTTASYTASYSFLSHLKHNPAIYEQDQGAGAGFSLPLGDKLNITAAYLATSSNNNSGNGVGGANGAGLDRGLTGGANTAAVQLTFTPSKNFVTALSYARTYDPDDWDNFGVRKGTDLARRPFGRKSSAGNHFGVSTGYRFSPGFNISGWAGWSRVRTTGNDLNNNGILLATGGTRDGDADIFNWAVNLGFPDLFRKGNYGGLGIGAMPYVTRSDRRAVVGGNSIEAKDKDVPLALQAFYNFKVNNNIGIQPQVYYISNPNGTSGNDNIWAGSLKTTFSF